METGGKKLTSGNPTLDKNLECIEKYNPELKEKLLNLPYLTNKIDLIETNLKESNLSYNGIPLHCQEGAGIEAQKVFAEYTNTPSSMHVLFGMGLGYLFKECCTKSKGKVFLYEPNLEILKFILEVVDLSEELSKRNVFIASDLAKFKPLYGVNYFHKVNFNFLTLDSYKNILYPEQILEIKKKIEFINSTCQMNIEENIKRGQSSLEAVLKNLTRTFNSIPLMALKNIYKGQTALIISKNLSLDHNIETIRKNRDRVAIFCTPSACEKMVNNDIHPDFINIIGDADCSKELTNVNLSKVNLIIEPYAHNTAYILNAKQNFILPSKLSEANNYWASLTGVDNDECTVYGDDLYAAIASAKMLGFSKIILVGQEATETGIDATSKEISINFLNEFAHKYQDLELINVSMTNNQIEGFINMSLEEALSLLSKIENVNLPTEFKYNKEKILDNIEYDIELLETALDEFTKAKEYIYTYERELKRQRTITPEAIKQFQALLSLYEQISADNDNSLYRNIAYKEDRELLFAIREEENLNLESVRPLFILMKKYFENVEKNILNALEKMKTPKEIISEGLNSKS